MQDFAYYNSYPSLIDVNLDNYEFAMKYCKKPVLVLCLGDIND
jgi:hypothetical protein